MVLRIFLRVIAQSLQAQSPGAANVNKVALHIGAVAFIHSVFVWVTRVVLGNGQCPSQIIKTSSNTNQNSNKC